MTGNLERRIIRLELAETNSGQVIGVYNSQKDCNFVMMVTPENIRGLKVPLVKFHVNYPDGTLIVVERVRKTPIDTGAEI